MNITNVTELLAAHPNGEFLELASFNDSTFGTCDITGTSPVWEMHPDTDEFFYIVEGNFEMTLLTNAGQEHHAAGAGSCFVVPRGVWHKPAAPTGAKFLFYTPGTSLHSDAADPRD